MILTLWKMKYVEKTQLTSDYIIDSAMSWITRHVIRLPDLDNICAGEGSSNFFNFNNILSFLLRVNNLRINKFKLKIVYYRHSRKYSNLNHTHTNDNFSNPAPFR